jgi:SAM-dependent MidA family methyltransferase
VTPFQISLRERIALEGPITVERYMGLCVQHYYATRDPFGAAGDFTTSPEISQIFGEILGLWALEIWASMGRPAPVRLVEIGPGRGTLMADALRAARLLPDFTEAASVHLVETSPRLRGHQERTLASAPAPVTWHDRLEDIPEGPAIVLANEFFDALPVRQFLATERGWCERLVGLDDDHRLVFGLKPEPETGLGSAPHPGATLEWPAAAIDVVRFLARRIVAQGGAALVIDYGYWGPRFGETLQAVRRHAFTDPLAEPGESDLTAHVDFQRLALAAAAAGAGVHGPSTQGDFLQALGIHVRAEALKQRATAGQSQDIERAVERLTGRGPTAMGELFKVLALSHPGLEGLPGLSRIVLPERS